MRETVRVCVVGAAGRMGRRTLALLDGAEHFELSAAVDQQAGEGITTDLDRQPSRYRSKRVAAWHAAQSQR